MEGKKESSDEPRHKQGTKLKENCPEMKEEIDGCMCEHTSLALLRLLMFSAMYLTLSMACLISGDTTENATTVLTELSCRLCFPQSPSGGSFVGWHGHGPFFTSPSLAFPSPNSKQLLQLFFRFFPSPSPGEPSDRLAFPEDSDWSMGRLMSIILGRARRKTARTQEGMAWVVGVR